MRACTSPTAITSYSCHPSSSVAYGLYALTPVRTTLDEALFLLHINTPSPTLERRQTSSSLLLVAHTCSSNPPAHNLIAKTSRFTQTNMSNNTASPASFLPINNKKPLHLPTNFESDDSDQLHQWPTPFEVMEETRKMGAIAGPTVLTGLLLYSRAMISMLFLGHLGELELAGGSLSIGFANITGYSIISGLAMGMEPICGQAFGARQWKILGLTLQRTVLLLLAASLPISLLWLNMKTILLWCGQDEEIADVAHVFTLFSLPDLFLLSFLHPLRIYLRTQNITLPLTYCSAASIVLHLPINFLLVTHLNMGIAGVALAMVWTNFNLVLLLAAFVFVSGVYKNSWVSPSTDCVKGWGCLLRLAVPSCASVCLEWWWYELMIMLCGLLASPKAAIASMGILIQTTSLVYVFPSALGLAVSTRVSNELGSGHPGAARIAAAVAMAGAVALGLAAMLFTTLLRHSWGRLFTVDKEVIEMTAAALPIAGLCELGNCPQTAGCGVLRGSARPSAGANINLGSFYLVGMPVAVLLSFSSKAGFAGLWLGLLAAQACCAAMMVYVVSRTDWAAQVERARQLTKSSNSNSDGAVKDVGDGVLEEIVLRAGEEEEEEEGAVEKTTSTPLETDRLLVVVPVTPTTTSVANA